MTIHREHPFLDPEEGRDPLRRWRGRLAAGVSLWTAFSSAGAPVGLTVSSQILVAGEPAHLVVALDPLADLTEQLVAGRLAAVSLLGHGREYLSEAFAGRAPAAGGPFTLADFSDTAFGPRLSGASWAGVELVTTVELGWSTLATCRIMEVGLADDADPLVHFRGGYRRLEGASAEL